MNKQLTEGKRLAESASKGIWEDFVAFHSPETMLNIYTHIEKLEAENDKLKDALNLIIKQFPVDYDIRITEIAKEALKET